MAISRASIPSRLVGALLLAAHLALPSGARAAPSRTPAGLPEYQRCTHGLRFGLGVRLLADADAQIRASNYRLADDLLDAGDVEVEEEILDARQAKHAIVFDDSYSHAFMAAKTKYAHDPHRDTLAKRAVLVDDIERCKAEDRMPAQPALPR
jgi:hypothetical protein